MSLHLWKITQENLLTELLAAESRATRKVEVYRNYMGLTVAAQVIIELNNAEGGAYDGAVASSDLIERIATIVDVEESLVMSDYIRPALDLGEVTVSKTGASVWLTPKVMEGLKDETGI